MSDITGAGGAGVPDDRETSGSREAGRARGRRRPNVLVILLDQLRWDCLGCTSGGRVRTPAIDEIASVGQVFTNAYSAAPVCVPSRYSLLSGLYPRQHGGLTNGATLAGGIDTFAKAMRRARYRTAAVGKMHLTPTYLDVGFDRLVLAEQDGDGRFEDDYHRDLAAEGLLDVEDVVDQRSEYGHLAPPGFWQEFGTKPSSLSEEWYSTSWIGDRAVEAVDDWKSDGELLVVSFIKPHHPFDVPSRWRRLYEEDDLPLLPGWTDARPRADGSLRRSHYPIEGLTPERLRRTMAAYFGSISQVDEQVGRVVASLRRRGLYEGTLIVVTADHGDYMGYHHMIGKLDVMYEPLVRVPLILKPVNSQGAGGVRHELVSLIDVAPTIVSQVEEGLGYGMKRSLLGEAEGAREAVFAEAREHCLVRTARGKLLLFESGEERFYDLDSDPYELTNVVGIPSYHDVVAYHRELLRRWAMWDARPESYRSDAEHVSGTSNLPAPDEAGAIREYVRSGVHRWASDQGYGNGEAYKARAPE